MTDIGDVLKLIDGMRSTAGAELTSSEQIVSLLSTRGVLVDRSLIAGFRLPEDLVTFWNICESARLFEDTRFGQWGLVLLTPLEALSRTMAEVWSYHGTEFREGDLIIGVFLGDAELLLVRCDYRKADHGAVMVASPTLPRNAWATPAATFGEFLDMYVHAGGKKYWE